jgi:hypothetical protein
VANGSYDALPSANLPRSVFVNRASFPFIFISRVLTGKRAAVPITGNRDILTGSRDTVTGAAYADRRPFYADRRRSA